MGDTNDPRDQAAFLILLGGLNDVVTQIYIRVVCLVPGWPDSLVSGRPQVMQV